MSSRRHSACCCVRLDDWIYKCACGKSKWKCGSRIAITGKWLILGLLDVATIAISIALVVRSEDTATEDQKDDVYSAAIFGFILVLMELPLIVLLMRGVGTAFSKQVSHASTTRLFVSCCCSREAFQWMLYGRQAFWFFEMLALLRVRCSVDPFLINIPDIGLEEYEESLDTCFDLSTNTTAALTNDTNVSYWLDQEKERLPSVFESVFNFTQNATEILFSECNCTLSVQSSCEPASLPGSLPDMAGCSYLGLRYDSFEQAESLGLAFLVVYTIQVIVRLVFMFAFPGLCCGQRDDSALASAAAEVHIRKFENAMRESSKLRDSVQRGDVQSIRDICMKREIIFVDTTFPPMPWSIGSNRLDRIGRKRLRESYKTLRHLMAGDSRLKRWGIMCMGKCCLGVAFRFILPLFPARMHEKVMNFFSCDPVFARANELHGGTHKIRLFMRHNDQAVLARRESRLQVSQSQVVLLRPPLNPSVPVSSVGVSQGHRGDCWFVAAITSLAHLRPDAIARLFESCCPTNKRTESNEKLQKMQQQQQSYNRQGVYGVWLYWDGSWQHQLVDDWFPCTPAIDGTLEPLGAKILLDKNEKSRPTATLELWVALLEKAAAKLAGSYFALDGGGVFEALRTLTGSPCTTLSRDMTPSDEIWNELLQFRRDGCVMVASPSKQAPGVGLTVAHLYGIIDVHRSKRSGVRFVRLQNPWGFSKFSGPYSVNSFAWDASIRNELRAKVPRDVIRVSKIVRKDENGKLGIQFTGKLVLTEVSKHAEKLGLEIGMRIIKVNGDRVETQDQVLEALSLVSSDKIIMELEKSKMTQTEKSSHVDLNDQHGSFWMDFRDFIMCFDKICVAHVARTFEKEEKEEKNSNDDDEEEEEERMCLNAQMTGSHGFGARSRARTQPHRFGFGLWGRDVSLKRDGQHVTTLYEVNSSVTLNVSVLLEYANPRRASLGATVMGPRMAALNTCFLAVFERHATSKVDIGDMTVPSPSFSASKLYAAIECAFCKSQNDDDDDNLQTSPKLIAFAKDIDGYNASLSKLTIRSNRSYLVLVGSLPHDSSVRNSFENKISTETNKYRLNFYDRRTKKNKTIRVTKIPWNLNFSIRISSALLSGSFCSDFSFVPTWNKTGWYDRKSRALHCPQSVSIQRVAFRLLRLQIRCCEQESHDLPPTLAFRPILCLVVRTIIHPSIRSDSQTKSYALATLVELLRSSWAFNNRQVPDTESGKNENSLKTMEQAGWRVCAPRFSTKIIVPLREAVSLCTELESSYDGQSEDHEKPILHTFRGRLEAWLILIATERFWFTAPPSLETSVPYFFQASNVMDGVELKLHERLIAFICELAGDWRENPGLGCSPESLEFEMTRELPDWMETNEMVRMNCERMKTLASRLQNGTLSHRMARLFMTRYRVVETLTSLLGLRPEALMKCRVHALETENAVLRKHIEIAVSNGESSSVEEEEKTH